MELHEPSELDIILRLLLAVTCGGVLGWERERHEKPAGLRTLMLVCLGSSAAALITLITYYELTEQTAESRIDPLRIIEGILGGIGFIGAGCVIQSRGSVQGMTTAATVWVVGALGIACGLGLYLLVGATLVIAVLVLVVIGWAEWKLGKSSDHPSDSLSEERGGERSGEEPVRDPRTRPGTGPGGASLSGGGGSGGNV